MFNAFLSNNTYMFDVVCLTEHWLSTLNFEFIKFDDYVLADIFIRSVQRGGGAMIMVRNKVKFESYKKISNLSCEKHCEVAATRLINLDIIVVCIYRSPDGNFEEFMRTVESVLGTCLNKRTIFCGDFNVRFNTDDSATISFCDLMSSFGFVQTVYDNTRYDNCIDNIFVNFEIDNYKNAVIDPGLSDHYGQVLQVNVNNSSAAPTSITCRPVTARGKLCFFDIISKLDWSYISSTNLTFTNKFSIFNSNLVDAFNLAFPVKNVNVKKLKKSWYTEKLCNRRDS